MMITKEQILEILDDTIEAENDNFAGLPSSPTIEGKNEAAEKLVKLFALHSVSVSLPSKDEVVSELYARVYNGEYKKRNVMRNNMQDCYYSGYLDCFDKLAGNER